ncbi:hypothetical protein IAR55_000569 [Kwoniella newhampshirensis]|uniref:Chitin synthase regulator 3 n=1 Tax=Kwoniella newhampshirensis TaxID=1651941 RepID=A0AAW0Z814_9TREE
MTTLTQSHQSFASSSSISSASTAATEPPRTLPLPSVDSLSQSAASLDTASDTDQIAWAQNVIRLVDWYINPSGGPTDFTHPDVQSPTTHRLSLQLRNLLESAVPIIIVVSTSQNTRAAALASYLKGRLQATGLCPDLLPKNNRQAFKDFESAARGGESRGWFRLGRDYEGVNDLGRARDCYERGVKRGDCECTYRMGMAHLLGQLNLPSNPVTALSLLRQASEISTIDFPQPSYVYGMLLAGELCVPVEIPPHLVLPPSSSPSETFFAQQQVAREVIERAAYFNYPPSQYKAGHIYEHASLGCAYDPLVSVNWYTFASKNGETEADMALSKWFLCGAEGHFPKNENLARTFAEKAARKGHPNGCFALGYYYELGVGGRKDLELARKWYQKAAILGNSDAPARLAALSAPIPASISMAEHESRMTDTLMRKHTQAKIRSDRNSISRPVRRPQPPSNDSNAQPEWPGPSSRSHNLLTDGPIPMSPTPRVGEIMSPNPNYQILPQSSSFPSRPPIPHQSFHNPPRAGLDPQTFPRRQGGDVFGQTGGEGRRNSRPYSGVSTSTSLSDLPIPEERRGCSSEQDKRKGPQTFAEMGFVSKPVQEEGCLVM